MLHRLLQYPLFYLLLYGLFYDAFYIPVCIASNGRTINEHLGKPQGSTKLQCNGNVSPWEKRLPHYHNPPPMCSAGPRTKNDCGGEGQRQFIRLMNIEL
jgi:hypothetical protein